MEGCSYMKLLPYIKLVRPVQWLKNLMLFFPPFLGGSFSNQGFFIAGLVPLAAFSFASSATYIINDIFDKDNDRHHPSKCVRPIASGIVPVNAAQFLVVVLLICSVVSARNVSNAFFLDLVVYVVVSLSYSAKLKDIVLLDIFCISSGFLLRLHAGGIAFNITISEWLFLSVFLLSVFLSTGKRLSEKQSLGDVARHHRKALVAYPKGFLEGTMYMTGGAVLVTYTMYVLSRHSPLLVYSVPLCCFGLMRYMLRVHLGLCGDPTNSLLKDLPLLIVGLIWVILIGCAIYG